MTDDEIITVVRAQMNGQARRIQCKAPTSDNCWMPLTNPDGYLNFRYMDYRVAPEPRKPREWLMGEDIDGNLVDSNLYGGGRRIRVREVI